MKIEKAIEVLKMENELMQFNPMTGDIEPNAQDAILYLVTHMKKMKQKICITHLIATIADNA